MAAPTAVGQQQPQQHVGGESQLWADKYAPKAVVDMCYPAMAHRLKQWLEAFPTQSKNNPNFKRAVLMSGPPGVGKTTTAHLVAKECGYQLVEFNASDHRSAKSLSENVSDVVDNRSLQSRFTSVTSSSGVAGVGTSSLSLDKFIILMDEVDGCDRGGVAEVIAMIKKTKVPILCTCNDRWHQKLRTLVNYVEDLKFSRPPFNLVATYIKERVLDREGCSVPHGLLQDVIKLEGNDIRSVLNNLQMWCRVNRHLSERQLVDAAKRSYKNEDVGLFGAAETFLLQGSSANANAPKKSFEELQALFYSEDLIDLFVQENYLHFKPDRGDWLHAVARAAASISRSDVVRRTVFVDQNWSVSNYHVLASAIFPCAVTRGHYQSFLPPGPGANFDRSRPVKFPGWLGNNSTAGKNARLAGCVAKQGQHPVHGFSGSAEDVAMDYCPTLAAALTRPLSGENGKAGVPEAMAVMDTYNLLRDDWDFVQDITRFKKMVTPSHQARVTAEVPTAVKTAFTRAYNGTHKIAKAFTIRGRDGAPIDNDAGAGSDDEDGVGGSDDDDGAPSTQRHRPEAPIAAVKAKAPAAKRAAKAPASKPAAKRGGKATPAPSPSSSAPLPSTLPAVLVDDDDLF